MESCAAEDDFETLKSFSETVHARCGASGSYLLRGEGASGAGVHRCDLDSAQYVARRNSGAFHQSTVQRNSPAVDTRLAVPKSNLFLKAARF